MNLFKKKSIICFATCSILLFGIVNVSAEILKMPDSINDTSEMYIFPITPENNPEKWKSFTSHDEMIDACQIPEDYLKDMSTSSLIDSCLNYPLCGDMIFYNSYQTGFESIKKSFNGLKELIERKDFGSELLRKYKDINLKNYSLKNTYPSIRLQYFEMLLSQEDTLSNMNADERKELLKIAKEKLKLKIDKYSDKYSSRTSLIMIGRILYKDDPTFKNDVDSNINLHSFLVNASATKITEKQWKDITEVIEKYK